MIIREFRSGDEAALWDVYFSSIRGIASADYTPEQIEAWAPENCDTIAWAARIQGMHPFVAEKDGEIVGYADLQTSGYIDHFFVAASATRASVGSSLMQHIHDIASFRGTPTLFSHVSITARPFFERWGFAVVASQTVTIRGVALNNFRMEKFCRLTRRSTGPAAGGLSR